MTYMTYMTRYQKWLDKGGVGNLMEDTLSDSHSNSSKDSDDEIDSPLKKGGAASNKAGEESTNILTGSVVTA